MKQLLLLASFVLLCAFGASAQKTIAAKDVAQYIGKTVVIYDKVYTTEADDNTGAVYLYLGKNYPDQYLTVVVKHEHRLKFTKEEPELYFKWVRVRVQGKLVLFKNKPAIIPTEGGELQIDMRGRNMQMPTPKH
jgi:hypothetical protein